MKANEDQNYIYNLNVRRIIRYTLLIVPFVMLFFGLTIKLGYVRGAQHYSDLALWSFTIVIFVLGLTQPKTKPMSVTRLTAYHLLMIGYALFVVGVDSMVIVWLPLIVISALNQGLKSLWGSAAGILLTVLIDANLQQKAFIGFIFFSDLATLSAMFISATILILISTYQTNDYLEIRSSRRRETTERHRLLSLINSLDVAVISTNTSDTIQIYNSAALSLLDTNQNLTGKKLPKILNLRSKNGHHINWHEVFGNAHGLVVRDDLSHYFSKDESMRLHISCASIRLNYQSERSDKQGYIFVLRDITKEKSLEEERDEFISVVSHELRTPITIVEGAISNNRLLVERGTPKDKLLTNLDEAHDQIEYLAKMINDLGALSRAQRGDVGENEDIDIQQMMNNLYKEYEPQASEKKLKMNLDLAPSLGTIRTNRLYLEEILQNFITNALKYTQKGSVDLIAKESKGRISLAVKDTGIGISKSDRKKIFDKFYRSEDYRTRETGGTGLGLYVVTKLTQKLGFTIDVDGRLNHGSTFSLLIPKPDSGKTTDKTG